MGLKLNVEVRLILTGLIITNNGGIFDRVNDLILAFTLDHLLQTRLGENQCTRTIAVIWDRNGLDGRQRRLRVMDAEHRIGKMSRWIDGLERQSFKFGKEALTSVLVNAT